MHVERRQENADELARIVFLDPCDSAVGRRHHYSYFIRRDTPRVSEKECHEGGNENEKSEQDPKAKHRESDSKHQRCKDERNSFAGNHNEQGYRISGENL